MLAGPTISDLIAWQIFDSRGVPTVACRLRLSNGLEVVSAAPSGTSVGLYEAKELRDGHNSLFDGMGVRQAVHMLSTEIRRALVGKTVDVARLDACLLELDGTGDKSRLGANALIAVSMAIARAQALIEGIPLWHFLAVYTGSSPAMPRCMANVLNGGRHADNGVAVQEIMIVSPAGIPIAKQIHTIAAVQEQLKKVLSNQGKSVLVGAEGGFAPRCSGNEAQAVEQLFSFLEMAVDAASLCAGKDVWYAMDVAASEFYDSTSKKYMISLTGAQVGGGCDARELIAWYCALSERYPLLSIEDGLDQDDWDGWRKLCGELGSKMLVIGDDLLVTNQQRLRQAVSQDAANAILIKPNQIGTVTQTLQTIALAKQYGLSFVISHRSGETNDSFIADLAVGTGAPFIKLGALCRGERIAKYNRLIEIAVLEGL